jgi:hypothetical protein
MFKYTQQLHAWQLKAGRTYRLPCQSLLRLNCCGSALAESSVHGPLCVGCKGQADANPKRQSTLQGLVNRHARLERQTNYALPVSTYKLVNGAMVQVAKSVRRLVGQTTQQITCNHRHNFERRAFGRISHRQAPQMCNAKQFIHKHAR